MSIRTIPLAALLLAAVSIAAVDAVKIEWKPKAGAVAKYKLTAKAFILGQEMVYGASVTSKILDVKTDGNIEVEEKQSDISIKFGDEDLSSRAPASITTTTVSKPSGETVTRKSDSDQDNPRLESAMEFVFPEKEVSTGDTWAIKRAADSGKGVFARETTFTYAGDETVGKWSCRKVTVSFKEIDAPVNMTTEGTVWISIEDGTMIKGVFKLKNVEFGPGLPPSDSDSEISRIE